MKLFYLSAFTLIATTSFALDATKSDLSNYVDCLSKMNAQVGIGKPNRDGSAKTSLGTSLDGKVLTLPPDASRKFGLVFTRTGVYRLNLNEVSPQITDITINGKNAARTNNTLVTANVPGVGNTYLFNYLDDVSGTTADTSNDKKQNIKWAGDHSSSVSVLPTDGIDSNANIPWNMSAANGSGTIRTTSTSVKVASLKLEPYAESENLLREYLKDGLDFMYTVAREYPQQAAVFAQILDGCKIPDTATKEYLDGRLAQIRAFGGLQPADDDAKPASQSAPAN